MSSPVPDPDPRAPRQRPGTGVDGRSFLRDPVILCLLLVVVGSVIAIAIDASTAVAAESSSSGPVFPVEGLFETSDLLWL